MGCILSFFNFNSNKSYKVSEIPGEDKSTSNHGRKSSKKQQQHQQQYQQYQQSLQQSGQQLGQQLEKSLGKSAFPPTNQSFIYKTVLEATVSDAKVNEEEARINAAEAPGPFEIETDLLSPDIEEAVIKIQANVRGYLTRKQYRGVTPDRSIEKSQPASSAGPSQEPIESSGETTASSGILAPPSSFSDTPKEFLLDHDDNQTTQGKKIAEKLIVELEKQVSQQAINKLSESTTSVVNTLDDVIGFEEREKVDCSNDGDSLKQSPVDTVKDELKSQIENSNNLHEQISSQHPLEIPVIETSGPEEAAIKIQAAFRGYQVRKTISRETSPCQTRIEEEDVHLREKDAFTQDPERESILVLDQLEECLSQELMRSSMHLGDEVSLSSHSTDLDLNASLQSNTSFIASESTHEDSDSKAPSNYSGDSSTNNNTNDSIISKTTNDDEHLTATILDTIEVEKVNQQKVETSSSESTLISEVNQVPKDFPTPDRPVDPINYQNSLIKVEEDVKDEPILFVSSDERADAIVDSKNEQEEIDPVIIVELNGKLDASNVSKSEDKPIDETDSCKSEPPKELNLLIHSESQVIKETEIEPLFSDVPTLVTESESKPLSDKLPVDCESSTIAINKLTPPTKASDDNDLPEMEPLFFDMISPSTSPSENQQIVTNYPVDSPKMPEQITSPILKNSLSSSALPENVKSDNQSDVNVVGDSAISLITASVQEPEQKIGKLTKEDSLGSDILILDDEKNDTLYDPFADNLTPISSNIQQSTGEDEQLTSSFVNDNLIKSVFDHINKDEGLLLYEVNSGSKVNNQTLEDGKLPDMNENINEIQDDILVNLDESDEEDDDSQKRPIETSIDSTPLFTSNIQRLDEKGQPIQSKTINLIDSFANKMDQSEKQSTDSVINIVSPTTQSENQIEISTRESFDIPKVTSTRVDEKVIQDLESEKQLKVELAFSPTVESFQQAKINHDNNSILDDDSCKMATNPFLNQPDFDSDLELGKINSNESVKGDLKSESTIETFKVENLAQESMNTIQQSPKVDIETIEKEDNEKLETNVHESTQNKQLDAISSISAIDNTIIDEVTDLKLTVTKDANENVKLPTKPVEECNMPLTPLEIQSKSQDDLEKSSNIVTNSIVLKNFEEKSSPMESSYSSTSSEAVDRPEIMIEPIGDSENVEQKSPTINEPEAEAVDDESESRLGRDETSPENSGLSARFDRETRSKSPNPFGRKAKRRHKKNRGGAN